jgi:hypothetical protein
MNEEIIKAYEKLKNEFPNSHVAISIIMERFSSNTEKISYSAYVGRFDKCRISGEFIDINKAVNTVIEKMKGDNEL